jgi:hypothetical protein
VCYSVITRWMVFLAHNDDFEAQTTSFCLLTKDVNSPALTRFTSNGRQLVTCHMHMAVASARLEGAHQFTRKRKRSYPPSVHSGATAIFIFENVIVKLSLPSRRNVLYMQQALL